jgi:hypothetical protein
MDLMQPQMIEDSAKKLDENAELFDNHAGDNQKN